MHRTVDKNFLMRIRAAPRGSVTSEQAYIIVRIPSTSSPPTPQIENQSSDQESGAAGTPLTQRFPNFISKFRGNAFVGIDKQNPILGCLRVREGLLISISRPGPL